MPMSYFCSCALRERQLSRWRHQATVGGKPAIVGGMGARRLLLVITSSHIFLLTIVSMVCGPNKSTRAYTNAAKAIYVAARSSKSSGSCWSWWSPSWRCCGPPAASAAPPLVMWGYVLRSVQSYYTSPLNSSLGASISTWNRRWRSRPRTGLDWTDRERELYSFTVCNQSLDYPCLDTT